MNTTPKATLTTFLQAFARLDLDAMLPYYADEATTFFPTEHERRLLQGKEQIRHAFASVLAWFRVRGIKSLSLEPRDMQVQEQGDLALATFHLHGEQFGRRTVVLRRQGKQWEILHLHASNAPHEE